MKKTFTRKPFGGNTAAGKLYKWSPDESITKPKKKGSVFVSKCTATAGSQGEDNVVQYVYKRVVVAGIVKKLAYVACDYVK
jgi:hypothetical protein